MLHWINLLFSIKGFDDNGKNGVGQTFQQVLTGNWIEIHDSWMTLSRKNPTPEGDGGNYFLENEQDFLIKLSIKPLIHLLEISIFSLNNVILRVTKIMNRTDKNQAHF